ncbi:type II toxin-antitoxin system VapC family toxin [soil metagenome]
MSLYVDSSAFLKLYFDEPDSAMCEEIMRADPSWVTGRHTRIEVRRNLARVLTGVRLRETRGQFDDDWSHCQVVELDELTCELAAELAEGTGVRSLDALHLAAARRVGAGTLLMLTYDLRLAQSARSIGWTILGA